MKKGFPLVRQIILHGIIVLLLFIMLYPLAMALWNSFKTDLTYNSSRWYPTLPLRVNNIVVAFKLVYRYVLNTVLVAVAGPFFMLLFSSAAAYAFGRMDFPFKKLLYSMVIMLMMIPGILTLVPSYLLYKSLGLQENMLALIVPIATGGCVFGVFLLTGFFEGMPKDIFESARIDGAHEVTCLVRIALPMCIPIMCTLLIIQIINIWNDLMWPRIIMGNDATNKYTISAGLYLQFQSEYTANMPVMFAGYLVSSLPLILLFIFANRFYIDGLINSAIKM